MLSHEPKGELSKTASTTISALPLSSGHSALHQPYLGLSQACLPAPQAWNSPLVLKFTGAPPLALLLAPAPLRPASPNRWFYAPLAVGVRHNRFCTPRRAPLAPPPPAPPSTLSTVLYRQTTSPTRTPEIPSPALASRTHHGRFSTAHAAPLVSAPLPSIRLIDSAPWLCASATACPTSPARTACTRPCPSIRLVDGTSSSYNLTHTHPAISRPAMALRICHGRFCAPRPGPLALAPPPLHPLIDSSLSLFEVAPTRPRNI
ncbi:hypothetical protein C8F04DRAFT_1269408 [Mycena alexandri]|uniref:Uncharacterized protein n=1 Tax=Mycena alexandri TaxID=1745969 RepID=A0AAD6WU20_9AGAR|nr:hypothetical protein C8F04DRAFT_1269408 [Mycena alexandri]